MVRVIVCLTLCLSGAAAVADAPMAPILVPVAGPSTPSLSAQSTHFAQSDNASSNLDEQLRQLKAEREALHSLEHAAILEPGSDNSLTATQSEQLRQQLKQLMSKFASQRAQEKAALEKKSAHAKQSRASAAPAAKAADKSAGKPSGDQESPPTSTAASATAKPVDALALAQALLRVGDFEGALQAYRVVEQSSLKVEDRVVVQYFTATCLRRLGRVPEASTLYRELANAKSPEFFVDCARWQLAAIEVRHQLDVDLDEQRKRRQALSQTGPESAAAPAPTEAPPSGDSGGTKSAPEVRPDSQR